MDNDTSQHIPNGQRGQALMETAIVLLFLSVNVTVTLRNFASFVPHIFGQGAHKVPFSNQLTGEASMRYE